MKEIRVIFLLIALLMILEFVEFSWTWRRCGHREHGSVIDFLNPFQGCSICREGTDNA